MRLRNKVADADTASEDGWHQANDESQEASHRQNHFGKYHRPDHYLPRRLAQSAIPVIWPGPHAAGQWRRRRADQRRGVGKKEPKTIGNTDTAAYPYAGLHTAQVMPISAWRSPKRRGW